MIELETPQIEPVEELARVRQVRGQPAAGRLRRDHRQRASARAAVLARGRRRHLDPGPRRLPRVQHDPRRQGRRHPIVLNVKKLRLKSYAPHPVQLKLVKSGAGRVTAADITETADVEIVNPELDADDARLGRRDHRDRPDRRARRGLPRRRAEPSSCPSASSRSTPSSRPCARSTTGSRTRASAR